VSSLRKPRKYKGTEFRRNKVNKVTKWPNSHKEWVNLRQIYIIGLAKGVNVMRLFCFATDISCYWQVTDTVLLHRGTKYYAKLLVTVLKTKEALKEEKLQRKEEEKRRFNGNNRDFLASVGVNEVMSSQNRRIRLRRTSQTVSECSDGGVGGGFSPIDAN